MKIFHVPCLEDNYSYIIVDEATKQAAAVDPCEPEKVIRKANEVGANLTLVLTTHHHWDHAGGNTEIATLIPGIRIVGGSLDNVQACTDQVEHGDKLTLGSDVNISCLHTPCHTKGHISYYVTSKVVENSSVFTGDTLFIAGCGKFFEGTAEQMYHSLVETLGSLPKSTSIYCGHEGRACMRTLKHGCIIQLVGLDFLPQPVEISRSTNGNLQLSTLSMYTVNNLRFASTIEPDNEKISQKLQWAQQQRKANLPTIPSSIGDEFETNPFMRVDLPPLQARVGCRSAVEALKEIRRLKDNWKGRSDAGL